ncbi:MAG TPA: CRISPR-associated helicase Cas3' [Syntrophorhabdus aromaticivorans]|nr:CRISPR-associated helicase Cas3' [Syntrophorhabdus aromaticivorans]
MIGAYGATGDDPGPNASYPLVTVVEPDKEVWTFSADASSNRTLKIETYAGLLGDAKKTAAKAIELVKDGGCCCVILNTVKQAQAVYRGLKKLPVSEKLLFHSRFSASDREEITKKVLDLFGKGHWEGERDKRRFVPPNRPKKYILVATQVVEQSLDVDFDHMISELAPIDLILQRSGRIKRHSRDEKGNLIDGPDRRGEPILHVLAPGTEGGKPAKIDAKRTVYEEYPLLRTLEILDGKKQVDLPEEFRPLIEAVYGKSSSTCTSDDLEGTRLAWKGFQLDLAAQAGQFLLCEPMADEFDPVGVDEVGDDSDDGNGWRARTRLGLEDVFVIPVDPEELPSLMKGDVGRDKVKELYQCSVKIPPHYWPPRTNDKKGKPVLMNTGRLRGAWLLPVKKEDCGWSWSGVKEGKSPSYTIRYDRTVGVTHGGDK